MMFFRYFIIVILLILFLSPITQATNMHKINITPLTVEYAEEIVEDLINLHRSGVIDSAAFSFTLVPEGIPAIDKAAECVRRFKIFQKLLKGKGVPTGILIQATWGHGWTPDTPTDFQKIRNFNGNYQYTMCPEGDPFRNYVTNAIQACAKAEPDFFMLDDDTRFITGRSACFCPLHTDIFNKKTGRNLTSDQLIEAVKNNKDDAIIQDMLLQESMIKYAHLIRDAIDSINPDIPCSFCLCAQDVRHAPAVAKILAGPKGEAVIRINNARYLQDSLRNIPGWLCYTATQVAAFDDDVTLICEPDTFPQNRYSTAAGTLNMHLIMSALEGCKGGKFWITRMASFEPYSGKAYRDILAKNAKFLDAVLAMKPTWQGISIPLPHKPVFNYPYTPPSGGWHETLGRMGLPFFFSKKNQKNTAFAQPQLNFFSEEELEEIFKGNVLVDGSAAIELANRKLTRLIGCEAQKWNLEHVTFEQPDNDQIIPSTSPDIARLTPKGNAKVISNLYHQAYRYDHNKTVLAPGAIKITHENGAKIVTIANFHGKPDGLNSFSIFNETRKRQLVNILNDFQALPIYYPGDAEILFKAAILQNNEKIAVILNIGLDTLEQIELKGPWTKNASPQILDLNGAWTNVDSTQDGDQITIRKNIAPLDIVIVKF
jgi:hypothetical protein